MCGNEGERGGILRLDEGVDVALMTRELERGLISAGVPKEQAEEIADSLEGRLSELATKQDLQNLRDELHKRLDHLERTMWRLAALGFAMWSATFGALMYAVFGQ